MLKSPSGVIRVDSGEIEKPMDDALDGLPACRKRRRHFDGRSEKRGV
jgi:hypothetical protein